MDSSTTDCIAAIATAPGQGAIAIVRVSGSKAMEVAERVFAAKTPLSTVQTHTVHFGRMIAGEEVLDEGLATVFREPHSYTGENVVELSCHGGALIARTVLKALIAAGARPAEPGEFTRRAFLNGKMDLSQAEAVADLIACSSERARRSSVAQLQGKLGTAVGTLRGELLDLCALLEIDLDFAEEGIEVISPAVMKERIDKTDSELERLEVSFNIGRVYREGASVVLVGKPNAGKSSLFNILLREERAIVAPHPGTTRDTIEEGIDVDGVLIRLTDTAGLREGVEALEAEGVRRARSTMRGADIALVVIDASSDRNGGSLRELTEGLDRRQQFIVALNKADLVLNPQDRDEILRIHGEDCHFTSCMTGEGLHELSRALVETILGGGTGDDGGLHITNERHYNSIKNARAALSNARNAVLTGKSNEFIAFDVREGVAALSEITGQITNDEILNSIFSRFCIGK